MRTGHPDGEGRLTAVLDTLAGCLEDLLVYLRAADGLLRSRAGRVGPTLLGAIEAAAHAVQLQDQHRAATVRSSEPATATVGLGPELARLRRLVADLDRTAMRLRRSIRLPVPVAAPDAEGVRQLLGDVLEQRLDELVPDALRGFLRVDEVAPPA